MLFIKSILGIIEVRKIYSEYIHEITHFLKSLRKLKMKNLLISSHQNADPDAVASAYALTFLLRKFHPKAEAELFFGEYSSKSVKLIHFMDIKPLECFKSASAIFLVDIGSFIQAPEEVKEYILEENPPIFIIDHHIPLDGFPVKPKAQLIIEEASSTSEIIYLLYKASGTTISSKVSLALLSGILYDSGHLVYASNKTIKVVKALLDSNADFNDAQKLIQIPIDLSEKIARLKAAQRMKIYRLNNWIVAISHVGAFEASSARAMLTLGADIAIVVKDKNGGVNISSRATENFVKETKISLAEFMAKVGEKIGGAGGGHATAAGAEGKTTISKAQKICLNLLKEMLESRKIERKSHNKN